MSLYISCHPLVHNIVIIVDVGAVVTVVRTVCSRSIQLVMMKRD